MMMMMMVEKSLSPTASRLFVYDRPSSVEPMILDELSISGMSDGSSQSTVRAGMVEEGIVEEGPP